MSNEANVSVRFSVQDAEVVRQALEKLGKDGQAALDKLNTAGSRPGGGLAALDKLVAGFKEKVVGLAVSLGPAGQALVALGPGGVAAAAGIGAVVAILEKLSAAAHDLADQSSAVRNFATAVGLSTDQVQALADAGGKIGLAADQVRSYVERFTIQMDQLRKGGGDLLEQINRIDPALARQLAGAKDTATAWDILARAYQAADTAGNTFARNAIARAVAGSRGGLAGGGLLTATASAGGLAALTQEQIKEGSVLSASTVNRLTELNTQIKQTHDTWTKLVAQGFSEDVLQRELAFELTMLKIVQHFQSLQGLKVPESAQFMAAGASEGMPGLPAPPPAPSADEALQAQINALQQKRRVLLSDIDFYQFKGSQTAQQNPWLQDDLRTLDSLKAELDKVNKSLDDYTSKKKASTRVEIDLPKAGGAPLPQSDPRAGQKVSAEFELNRPGGLRDQVAVLGQAATPAEQYKLKLLELAAAQEKNAISTETATRAMAAHVLNELQQVNAIRERLGIVNAADLQAQRSAELDDAQAKGFIANAEERAQAERIAAREIKNTTEALQIRGAQFQSLKALEIETGDLNKQFDRLGTDVTNGVTSGLTDIAFSADGTAASLGRLEQSLARMALQMALNITVGRLLSSVTQSIFGALGVPSPGGSSTGTPGGLLGHNAEGTDDWPGGLTWVGEKGVELVDLPRGARVTSNARLRQALANNNGPSGGGSVTNNTIIENHGADVRQGERKRNASGGFDMRLIVRGMVNEDFANGEYTPSVNATMRAPRRVTRR